MPVSAQLQRPGAPQAAPYKVGTVTVRFVGTANVNEQVVRANMQVREGGELDDTIIDRDIRSLYKTGLFEFINVNREVLPDRTVNLVVEVTPKFRVLTVRYEGNEKVKSRKFDKDVKTKPNQPLDERQIKEDAQKIKESYQKSGYNQAMVNYEIERDRSTGFGTVIFRIKEGNKVKISDVRFLGNNSIKSGRLRKQMETKRWWIFSWLTGTGHLKDDEFEDDIGKVRDYYIEEGFLDVDIPPEKIIYDYPKKGKLVLTIQVNEGRRYRIGDITIKGNKIYSSALLRLALRQRSGMIFSPSKIDKDVESLRDFYGKDGYLDTDVRPLRKPNIATGNIDLEYEVNESEQYFVESIKIDGNSKTKSIVILRELVLGPGEVFNTIRMQMSKQRLDNTRFFDEVNTKDETTNIPGRRNLKITVREARTGNLTFGAGFSSLEKGVIFAELTQSNFDLFNRRSLFQGDGQKFRMKLQYGSRSSEAILAFEEPWLFERQLALGFQLYRTSSNYDNSFYDEIRTGGEVYLRKLLFELVEGRLSYSYETLKVDNVAPEALGYVTDARISKVGFTLLRDTRDKLINTTSGDVMQFTTELTGGPLGGSLDVYRLEARGSKFLKIFDTQDQVISVIARGGVVDNYGQTKSLGNFRSELWRMGGSRDLRGFENFDVGPKDSFGQYLGGKSYGMFSIEYSIDIVSPIRFALFYDAGFVNVNPYDFNPAAYNDNFGIGLGLFVAGAPLRLDLAFPRTTDKTNNKGNQFNFSFGTRF